MISVVIHIIFYILRGKDVLYKNQSFESIINKEIEVNWYIYMCVFGWFYMIIESYHRIMLYDVCYVVYDVVYDDIWGK